LVAGPNSWNYLPDRLRDQALSSDETTYNGIIYELLNTHGAIQFYAIYPSVARKVSKFRIIIKSY